MHVADRNPRDLRVASARRRHEQYEAAEIAGLVDSEGGVDEAADLAVGQNLLARARSSGQSLSAGADLSRKRGGQHTAMLLGGCVKGCSHIIQQPIDGCGLQVA